MSYNYLEPLYGSLIRRYITIAHYSTYTFFVTARRPLHYGCRSGHLELHISRFKHPLVPLGCSFIGDSHGNDPTYQIVGTIFHDCKRAHYSKRCSVVLLHFHWRRRTWPSPSWRTFKISSVANDSLVAVCWKCSMFNGGRWNGEHCLFLNFFLLSWKPKCIILMTQQNKIKQRQNIMRYYIIPFRFFCCQ